MTAVRPGPPALGAGVRRVVEIAHGVAGSTAGMYLAQAGFDVTRIVADAIGAGSDSFAGTEYGDIGPLAYGFLGEGKSAVSLDLTSSDGRVALVALVGAADIVVEQLTTAERESLGEEYAGALSERPELIVVRLSPFGSTGPAAGQPATELIVDAAGGWLQQIGEPERGPIRPPGHQSEVMAGLAAVMSSVAALFQVDDTGRGDVIDVASRECVTWFQMNTTTTYTYSGSIGRRTGGASDVNYPQGVFSCRDGLVGINVLYYIEWFRFCDLFGREDWKTNPRLKTPLQRFQNREIIDEILLPYLAARTAQEIYEDGQSHKLPFGMVNGPQDLLRSKQLAARGFWRTASAGGCDVIYPSLPAVYLDAESEAVYVSQGGTR